MLCQELLFQTVWFQGRKLLGTQGLKWARRAIAQNDTRRTFLQKLLSTVGAGLAFTRIPGTPVERTLYVLGERTRNEIMPPNCPRK
jgi:hypothetical protein